MVIGQQSHIVRYVFTRNVEATDVQGTTMFFVYLCKDTMTFFVVTPYLKGAASIVIS